MEISAPMLKRYSFSILVKSSTEALLQKLDKSLYIVIMIS